MTEQRKRQLIRLQHKCRANYRIAELLMSLYRQDSMDDSLLEKVSINQQLAADYYNLIAVLRFGDE